MTETGRPATPIQLRHLFRFEADAPPYRLGEHD